MYRKIPRLFALALALFCSRVHASDSIEIFYFSDQETYRLLSFDKTGLPVLEESDEELPEFTGVRDGTWHVRGELSLSSEYAIPFVDYEIKRRPIPYSERGREERFDVRYKVWSLANTRPWMKSLSDDTLIVTAWLIDGELGRFYVQPQGVSGGDIPQASYLDQEALSGYPLVWLVKDGALVAKPESLPFDPLLVEGGALDIELHSKFKDGSGRTVAHYLAANGLVTELETLLSSKKKLASSEDKRDKLPIALASVTGRAECARVLLEAGSPRLDGWESLNVIAREAAMNGHRGVVAQLTNGKSDRNSKWERSWAMATASNNFYTDIVKDLIERKASISMPDDKRAASLFGTFTEGYPDLAFVLMDHYKMKPKQIEFGGGNLFHAVAGYADVELLESVRGFEIDMLAKSEKGVFPLDVAIAFGNVPAICWFLENGGRPDYEGEALVDPFQQAIQNGRLDSVTCLISYGYDVNDEISQGVTPLMYATYGRRFGIAEALLEAGGAWELDHTVVDLLLLRVLENDKLELLRSMVEQGLSVDRKVFGELSLASISDFYESSRCGDYLREQGTFEGNVPIHAVKSVEKKPRLVKPAQINYPEHLQEKYGSLNPVVRAVIGSDGSPLMLAVADEDVPQEIFFVLEQAFYSTKFDPALMDGVAVPVEMRFRIPVKAVFSEKDTEVFSLVDVDEKPTALQMSTPLYPYALHSSQQKGRVVVEFVLAADGSVHRARAEFYTHEAFRDAAIAAVKRSVWQPAKHKGAPVACKVRIPILFTP